MMGSVRYFTNLCAVLGRSTLAASIFWFLAALFSGKEPFITQNCLFLWVTAGLAFTVNYILLRKGRNLFIMVLLDAAMTAGIVAGAAAFFSDDGMFVNGVLGICAYMGLLFQLYWHHTGLDEAVLVVQSQVLTLAAAGLSIIGKLLHLSLQWPFGVAVMAAVSFAAVVSAKNSGIRGDSEEGGATLKSALTYVVLILTLVAAIAAAGVIVKPLGAALLSIYDAVGTAFGKITEWLAAVLSSSGRESAIRVDGEGSSMGETLDTELYIEGFGGIGGFEYILALVFVLGVAACAVYAVWLAVRMLMGRKLEGRTGKKAGFHYEKNEPFFKSLYRGLKKLLQNMKGRTVLSKHRGSIGALLLELEKQVRHDSALRRRREETPREFIDKLSDAAVSPEMSVLLKQFADEVDFACYGREKDWLRNFSRYSEMESALKQKWFAAEGKENG